MAPGERPQRASQVLGGTLRCRVRRWTPMSSSAPMACRGRAATATSISPGKVGSPNHGRCSWPAGPARAMGGAAPFTVGELGFGTGLNIAALLDLWRATGCRRGTPLDRSPSGPSRYAATGAPNGTRHQRRHHIAGFTAGEKPSRNRRPGVLSSLQRRVGVSIAGRASRAQLGQIDAGQAATGRGTASGAMTAATPRNAERSRPRQPPAARLRTRRSRGGAPEPWARHRSSSAAMFKPVAKPSSPTVNRRRPAHRSGRRSRPGTPPVIRRAHLPGRNRRRRSGATSAGHRVEDDMGVHRRTLQRNVPAKPLGSPLRPFAAPCAT